MSYESWTERQREARTRNTCVRIKSDRRVDSDRERHNSGEWKTRYRGGLERVEERWVNRAGKAGRGKVRR